MDAGRKIIVALDVGGVTDAQGLVKKLQRHVGCFKVGLELISAGASIAISNMEGFVFYDGKFHDIPNTVGAAARVVANIPGVVMFNVHASAGIEAMKAAVQNKGSALVLAVTILTSLNEEDTNLIYGAPVKAKVLQFARDAAIAGCDGIICSPQELEFLGKQQELKNLLKVTPGVRPLWAATDDQKRIMTPKDAIKAGADYLVIGRPITRPPAEIGTSVNAAIKIAEEIETAMKEKEEVRQ